MTLANVAAGSTESLPNPDDFGIGILFWSIRDAVVVGEAESGRIVLFSPSAERMFGYAAAEVLGRPIDLLVPPDLKPLHHAGLARFLATGHGALIDGHQAAEIRALHKGGGEITIELSLTPIEQAALPGRYILALIRDVSERKQAERARLDLEREQAARLAAQATQERLGFLAEASAQLASSLDYDTTLDNVAHLAVPSLADWCVVDVIDDEGALRRVAVAHADPAKRDLAEVLRRYPPDTRKSVGIGRVLRTGVGQLVPEVPAGFLEDVAIDATHLATLEAIGQRSWMGVALRARGQTLGVVSLVAAESGRRFGPDELILAEELATHAALAVDNARLYREAQAAIAARDRFLAVAAHELRTPITTIKATAELLGGLRRRGQWTPEREERHLNRIVHASGRLAGLTEDLLDFARLRGGELPLRIEHVDLGALVHAAVDRYRDQPEATSAWSVDAVADRCWVMADRDRIDQVLTNLFDNAVKYSPEGGTIRVEVRPDGEGVHVSVADEGIGLPAGAQEAIFEPFGRAANAVSAHLPGIGIGLSIAKGVIDRHGGRIWAESPGEGAGTTFGFWIPCSDQTRG